MTSAPDRPHCELPDACRAKGAGHCQPCHCRAISRTPEGRASRAEQMALKAADPAFKARARERMRRLHEDPVFRQAIKAAQVARNKETWADPVRRAAQIDAIRQGIRRKRGSQPSGESAHV